MMGQVPLKIGGVVVDPPILLAPMAGYTDTAFRSICMEFGCGATYTEVVNAQGMMRESPRTMHLLESSEVERPVAAHIYGKEPEVMAKAAQVAEKLGRYDTIDVNCGCPVRKIVHKGCGAALMKDPEQIGKITGAINEAVKLPVTIKTRIGYDEQHMNLFEMAEQAEQGGAVAIAVHGRFAAQVHSGPVDWATIGELKSRTRMAVIGNGGVTEAGDAIRLLKETGIDGVMIGRGAVGNPWLFREIACLVKGEPYLQPTREEREEIIFEHLRRLTELAILEYKHRRRIRWAPEKSAILAFRGHLCRYLQGEPGWRYVRRGLNDISSSEDVARAIEVAFSGRQGN